jgi:type II secretory pathway component GspD/PulD (secretin)
VAVDPATGGTLLVPRQFSRLGFLPGTPGFGTAFAGNIIPNQPYGQVGMVPDTGNISPHSGRWTPVPILNNVLGFADPRNIQTGVPGSFAGSAFQQPALQMFGSFLDNIQVDFLLRATQADGRSTFLEAPRLTLSNGQRAYVAVVTQQAYISGLNAVVAEEVGQVEPQISTLNTGSVLDVEATVGADRRYVTLTVRAGRAVLEELVPVEVQSTGTSTRGVGAVVQLPRVQVALARATITVPEGGTILLGGLRQTGEVELEGGVPILSKIPILKRAYSSRSMAKDENILLILVKPNIIIQDEAEEDAFPSFSMR